MVGPPHQIGEKTASRLACLQKRWTGLNRRSRGAVEGPAPSIASARARSSPWGCCSSALGPGSPLPWPSPEGGGGGGGGGGFRGGGGGGFRDGGGGGFHFGGEGYDGRGSSEGWMRGYQGDHPHYGPNTRPAWDQKEVDIDKNFYNRNGNGWNANWANGGYWTNRPWKAGWYAWTPLPPGGGGAGTQRAGGWRRSPPA
ncbi:MAG: hypothetical protein ACKO28_05585 [Cyanobium sp.]